MSLPAYPMQRSDPYGIPRQLAELAARGPVDRVRLWDDSTAWIVTGWREARAVLADNRFSADVGRPGYPHLRPGFRGSRLAAAAGGAGGATMLRMDPPAHDELRRLLTGFFTVRRIATLRPMVEERAAACLDAVQAAGPPCDLISTLAVPLPSLVLCELLGVPVADRPHFEELSVALIDSAATQRQLIGTLRGLSDYLEELVTGKEKNPETDLLSVLVQGPVRDGRMSRADLLGTARLLLTAGHETSASMLSLTLATLLRDRTAWDFLGSAPEAIPAAVEELLRFHTIASAGLSRVATADVTVADQIIRAGEGVIVSVEAANRDPAAFEDPDRLRLDRGARHHLSFGYGVHQCLGQALARVELQVAIERTIRRFPTLRVAEGEGRIEFAHDRMIHGVHRLEVAW
ncbi:MAG: cytochrome P450 [Catenulispora sp.]|nr:cytochrome P450 [Catenulispora sp.]